MSDTTHNRAEVLTDAEIAALIYKYTELSAQQFPDEYVEIFDLCCALLSQAAESAQQAPTTRTEPVAWLWQYIGKDPMAHQIQPCARSLHEMDPHNPPYPDTWKPVGPLYTSPAPSASEPDYERRRAIMEGERNAAADDYFKARWEGLDTIHNRRIFEAGFERGYSAAPVAAQPQEARELPPFKMPLPEPLRSIGQLWIKYAQETCDPNDIAYAVWKAVYEAAQTAPAVPDDEKLEKLIISALTATQSLKLWAALSHSKGPYSINVPNYDTVQFVRHILSAIAAAPSAPAAPVAAQPQKLFMRDPITTANMLIHEWNETPQDSDEWGNRAVEALNYLASELHKEIVARAAAPVAAQPQDVPADLAYLLEYIPSGPVREEAKRKLAALAAQPAQDKPQEAGWKVRERRNADGELLDCFVEAPAENDMPYGIEVLGDDYEGFGGVERKLQHCKLIVALVNGAAPSAPAQEKNQ